MAALLAGMFFPGADTCQRIFPPDADSPLRALLWTAPPAPFAALHVIDVFGASIHMRKFRWIFSLCWCRKWP
ncbi:MAG: hypothetical protein P8Z78_04665 [Gammaproteobacteria bacterium]